MYKYKKVFNYLEKMAADLNCSVIFSEEKYAPYKGRYSRPVNKKAKGNITILRNKFKTKMEMNITFAHELGHHMSYLNGYNKEYINAVKEAYKHNCFCCISNKSKALILEEELIAWNEAEKIFQNIKEVDINFFEKHRNNSISAMTQMLYPNRFLYTLHGHLK